MCMQSVKGIYIRMLKTKHLERSTLNVMYWQTGSTFMCSGVWNEYRTIAESLIWSCFSKGKEPKISNYTFKLEQHRKTFAKESKAGDILMELSNKVFAALWPQCRPWNAGEHTGKPAERQDFTPTMKTKEIKIKQKQTTLMSSSHREANQKRMEK